MCLDVFVWSNTHSFCAYLNTEHQLFAVARNASRSLSDFFIALSSPIYLLFQWNGTRMKASPALVCGKVHSLSCHFTHQRHSSHSLVTPSSTSPSPPKIDCTSVIPAKENDHVQYSVSQLANRKPRW